MPSTVFVSSTSTDLFAHREAVHEALEHAGFHPVDMKNFMARPYDATTASLEEVAEADLFVGIYAWRYGHIPEGSELSITEQEFNEADSRGKPIFCFLVDESYKWPPESIESGAAADKLATFKKRIDRNLVRATFTEPNDLATKVLATLTRWERKRSKAPDREHGPFEGVGIVIGSGPNAQVLADVRYNAIKPRGLLRELFDPLIEDYIRLFGGRDAALSQIANFIRDPKGGYLFITAPAGFGKTAIVCSIVNNSRDAFAYHFFTPLYGESSLDEELFLRNILEQMGQWHGFEESLPHRLNELRALYQQFIGEPLDNTQVLVLDGLDEVTGWQLAPYLSRGLPPKLHIIVTARDVGQDWRAKQRLPDDQTIHLPLGGLNREDVRRVFMAAGGSASSHADDSEFLSEVMRVSLYKDDQRLGADPFYVHLLAEDAADGRLTAANVADEPEGLEAYLDKWWKQVKAIAGDKPVRDLFGTLTVALGPIGRAELEAVNPSLIDDWATDSFDDVLHQVRRWIVRDETDRYSLVHPRFRSYMRGRIRTKPYLDRLLAYCARAWSYDDMSEIYALRYYMQHLAALQRYQDMFDLRDLGFLEVKIARLISPQAVQADYQALFDACEAEGDVGALLRLGLHRSAIADQVTALRDINVVPTVIGSLVDLGEDAWWKRGVGLCSLIPEVDARVRRLLDLCRSLAPTRSAPASVLDRLDTLLEDVTADAVRDELRLDYIDELCRWGEALVDRALDEVEKFQSPGNRAKALAAIADASDEGETLLSRALTAAEMVYEPKARGEALARVALGYGRLADESAISRGLSSTLVAVEQMEMSYLRAAAVKQIAECYTWLPASDAVAGLAATVDVARYQDDGAKSLIQIAYSCGRLDDCEMAARALDRTLMAIKSYENEPSRSTALGAIAHYYGRLEDSSLALAGLAATLDVARSINERGARAEALAQIGCAHCDVKGADAAAVLQEALSAAADVVDHQKRAEVLRQTAVGFARLGEEKAAVAVMDDARAAAGDIEPDWNRLTALSAIERHMGFRPMLSIAVQFEDDLNRSVALVDVVRTNREETDPATSSSNLEEILAIAMDVVEHERVKVLIAVAESYSELADRAVSLKGLELTLLAAREVQDDESRAEALANVANAYAKLGEKSTASSILDEALAGAGQYRDGRERARALCEMAQSYLAIGDLETSRRKLQESLKAAEEIRNHQARASALTRAAHAFLRCRDSDAAMATLEQALADAEKVNVPGNRGQALVLIAQAYGQVASSERAAAGLEKTVAAAERIDYEEGRSDVLVQVAEELSGVTVGEAASAARSAVISSAGRVLNEARRVEIEVRVANVIAAVDGHTAALEFLEETFCRARQIDDPGRRAIALAKVAHGYLRLGDGKALIALTECVAAAEQKLEDTEKNAWAWIFSGFRRDWPAPLMPVVEAISTIEERSIAESGLKTIAVAAQSGDASRCSHLLTKVGRAYDWLGDLNSTTMSLERAEDLAASAWGEHTAIALSRVSEAYLEIGRKEDGARVLGRAISAANQLTDVRSRSGAIAEICSVLSAAGREDEVLALMSRTDDHHFVRNCKTLLRTGDVPAEASRPSQALYLIVPLAAQRSRKVYLQVVETALDVLSSHPDAGQVRLVLEFLEEQLTPA